MLTRIAALGHRAARPPIHFHLGSTELQPDSPVSVLTLIELDDGEALARGLLSWLAAGVRDIVVLAGPQAQECHAMLEHFPVTVLRRRADPGLAHLDLMAGWRAATGEVVAIADPGTVWARDVAQHAAGSFAAQVGVVTIRHNAYHVSGLAHRLADIDEDLATVGTAAAASRLDQSVINSWRGTAVFRRSALIEAEDRFTRTGPLDGDPREVLARLVMDAGATAAYQPLARDWPIMPGTLRGMAASAFRDGVALRRGGSGAGPWQPYRTACVLAAVLAGPMTLTGLGYGAAAIWAGVWQLAAVLAGWTLISHAILLIPHLRRRPTSLFVVPVHLTVTAALGVVALAGLITRPFRRQTAVAPPSEVPAAVVIEPEFRLMPATASIPVQSLAQAPVPNPAHVPAQKIHLPDEQSQRV